MDLEKEASVVIKNSAIVVYHINGSCVCMICPNCDAHEIEDCQNPDPDHLMGSVWQIQAYKVGDEKNRSWSHCVVCDCWFTDCGLIEK